MVVAIEGMDGAGKTTVCDYVSRNYNFEMVEKPTKYFFIDEDGKIDYDLFTKTLNEVYASTKEVRSAFFGLGNMIATRNRDKENIVLDRHIISNYYWNGDKKFEEFYNYIIEKCGIPDLTILLHASPETRRERLMHRDLNDGDLYDETVFDDGDEKMIYFLNKYKFPYVYLETENKSIEEVCKEIDKIFDNVMIRNGGIEKYGKRH